MSCLSCVAVVDDDSTPNTGVKVKKHNKKVSTNGDEVYVEEKDTNTAGVLKIKVGSVAYAWKKVRVVVDDNYLMIYETKKGKPSSQFPLHLCNVRPLSSKRFRVLCAPNKSEEFRAKDNKQLRGWVTLIQEGIARQLSIQPGNLKANSGVEILAALRTANDANKFCADCNAPDPKWVSVNIGCIICIECSGVHRQLGVTTSKVRSFELDMWADKTAAIEKLGNADVNGVLEAKLTAHTKPRPDAEREEREKYIYEKYVSKLYRVPSKVMKPNPGTSKLKLSAPVLLVPNSNRSSIQSNNLSNVSTPNQKRIHIGSDVFEILEAKATSNYPPYRRPSFGFDITRRGSYAGPGTATISSPPQSPNLAPTPAPSPSTAAIQKRKESGLRKGTVIRKENGILEQRRFSLFQAR